MVTEACLYVPDPCPATTADAAIRPSPEQAGSLDEKLRALDRSRILRTRAAGRSWRLLWLLAGPGVLVMLGENDGPSMVSYATTGATYGVGFFVPFILATFVMAYIVQEMTVRLGIATGRGHAELIFQRFGPFWGYFAMGDLVFGNILTLVTEFIAIQAGGLYFGVPSWLSVLLGLAMITGSLLLRRYATWERLLMGPRRLQSAVYPGRPDGTSERAGARSRHRPLGAAAGRLQYRVRHSHPRQYRRDRDPLDDLLPAKRRGRQRAHPRRPAPRAGWTPPWAR